METHVSREKPSTRDVIRTLFVTSITILVGKYISDLVISILNTWIPQTTTNKFIFNCIVIFCFVLLVLLITNLL